MISKIDELVEKLDKYSAYLWCNKKFEFSTVYSELITSMFDLFPQIIASYTIDEKLLPYSNDATYWPMQMQKIIDLLQSGKDSFAIADALYFELRANLVEYRKLITE